MPRRLHPTLPSRGLCRTFAAGASILLVLAGCSDAGIEEATGEPPTVSRLDSAGVEVITSSRPAWTEDERWEVDPEPAFSIRSPDDAPDPEFVLHEVGDIITLSDGRIVVENRGTSQLLVFDASGSHLTTWGGEGDGPGEFRRMRRMFACPGDRILVQEYHRATVLDAEGGVVETTSRRQLPDVPSSISFYAASSDCSAALWGWSASADIESRRGTVWKSHRLAWIPYEDRPITGLGTFVRLELQRETGWELPFSLWPDWATDGDFVFYGTGDVPEVTVLGRDGAVVRSIRWRVSPNPITGEDWDAYEQGFDQLVSKDPRWEVARIEPEMLPFDSMPIFGQGYFGREMVPGLRLDGEGSLWIRQYEPVPMHHRVASLRGPVTSQRWWIMDPEGRWLGELETPDNLPIRTIRDGMILGVARDDLDVEEIRAYRIRRGGSRG